MRVVGAFASILNSSIHIPLVVFVFFSGIVVILYCMTPILEHYNYVNSARYIGKFLSYFCHQLTNRSIKIGHYPMGLCARCISFYTFLTIFLGLRIFGLLVNKASKYIVILLLLPLTIDGGIQLLLHLESSNGMRVITGFFAALACALSESNTYIKYRDINYV